MGFMDNFTSDSPVTVKQPEYYAMVKEAAKAELITNAVNAEVPGYYIQAMITGKKPDFLNTLDAEEEETGFRTEYEQITGAVVSIFEAWEKENGVESAAAGLHRLIDDLSKNRIEELRVIRENREAENARLSKLLIPPLCGGESRAEETESEETQHDADGSSTEDKRTEPPVPTNQITFLRDNIYRYYGVNDKILTSTLNDTEFISFYENVIEPISVQLSYEFTFKLLTPREIGYGNRIDFVANLLQYATLQTRETIGGGMFDRGALTINEYRELMYYGPVEDGDQRLVSLNYVKVGDQSLYQVGQQNEPPDDTGANDREKRAMQAAARAYMQIMKGG